MVSFLESSAVYRWFDPRSCPTTDCIGIRCFSAKHRTLMSKSKVWLARNQVNVRMTRQICPWTAVSVSHHYLNRTHRVACSIVQSEHYHLIELYLLVLI